MRTIESTNYTVVLVVDEKGAGGANHKYEIAEKLCEGEMARVFTTIDFQDGAIQENGVNGIQNEDLLAIVIDRLKGFQEGDFACKENVYALICCEAVLTWLQKRTADRIERGVEGKSIL